MAKQFTKDDEALLAELGVDSLPTKSSSYTPREERVIAGFEEVHRYVETHKRLPEHGEDKDIFERLYAVRLDRIRRLTEFHELLEPFDTLGILKEALSSPVSEVDQEMSDEELLNALGVEAVDEVDVTKLTHVRSRTEIRAAEEVAQRTKCEDFETFKPLFEEVQREINAGERRTVKYQDNADVMRGDYFVLDGQKVLVEALDEPFVAEHGRKDRRLRVVYDNGTESDMLLRSLQRALNKDSKSRRVLPADTDVPALFSGEDSEDDLEAGHLYVLRSLSDDPFIMENREVIHKIGVTGGEVKRRIGNAKRDPTFLLADVEIVGTFKLANINRTKLEQVIHQFFGAARMDVKIRDRFGEKVEPREWFLVPLPMIQKAIELVLAGELENCRYDPESAKIIDTRAG